MFLIVAACVLSALYSATHLFRRKTFEWRAALRVGIGGAFMLTGVDHFVSAQVRYVPMMPTYLASWATELVLLSGFLELAGAVGLLLPTRAWKWLHLPDLRAAAGVGLAMLLSVLVTANSHMAETGIGTAGLPGGQGYLLVRPFLQPLIVLWVLVASGAVFSKPGNAGAVLPGSKPVPSR